MEKTLYTAPMIETFNSCRRAYQLVFGPTGGGVEVNKPSAVLKKFLLKTLVEINRGRVVGTSQVQKFLGQHWPADKFRADDAVKAFLYAYKSLTHYVEHPYRPEGSQVVGAGLKVRARIPHDRVYIEDTFDLILWYPRERKLEFVDYHLHPLKPFNNAFPSTSILVKQFLAERIHCRWPFEKLSLTFCKVSPTGVTTTTLDLDESLYKLHWPNVQAIIEEMKLPLPAKAQCSASCNRCAALEPLVDPQPQLALISRTA